MKLLVLLLLKLDVNIEILTRYAHVSHTFIILLQYLPITLVVLYYIYTNHSAFP